jgi:putative hydrolase of the HAD superfamily
MIRAVIFDWGGVIQEPLGEAHLNEWAQRLGVSRSVLGQALAGPNWRALTRGQIDAATARRRLAEALDLPDVDRFYREFFASERLNPGMLELVERLRRSGIKVALLTNNAPGLDELLRSKWDLDPRVAFDVYVNSAEVGLAKPDPEIYELTLVRLGVSPEEAVFIDDNATYVTAAADLGLRAIHLERVDATASVIAKVEGLVGWR